MRNFCTKVSIQYNLNSKISGGSLSCSSFCLRYWKIGLFAGTQWRQVRRSSRNKLNTLLVQRTRLFHRTIIRAYLLRLFTITSFKSFTQPMCPARNSKLKYVANFNL